MAHRVGVMYAGEIVEVAAARHFFAAPQHPYTQALFAALPDVCAARRPLATIPGQVPPLAAMPAGCRFADRCPHVMPVCRDKFAGLAQRWPPAMRVRCHWSGQRGRASPTRHVSALGDLHAGDCAPLLRSPT